MKGTCSIYGCKEPVHPATADWEHPVCTTDYCRFGSPKHEPYWNELIEVCQHAGRPRVFSYKRTAPAAMAAGG